MLKLIELLDHWVQGAHVDADLLEAYLDVAAPDWRAAATGEQPASGGPAGYDPYAIPDLSPRHAGGPSGSAWPVLPAVVCPGPGRRLPAKQGSHEEQGALGKIRAAKAAPLAGSGAGRAPAAARVRGGRHARPADWQRLRSCPAAAARTDRWWRVRVHLRLVIRKCQ